MRAFLPTLLVLLFQAALLGPQLSDPSAADAFARAEQELPSSDESAPAEELSDSDDSEMDPALTGFSLALGASGPRLLTFRSAENEPGLHRQAPDPRPPRA